jgi:hypothetical protein
MLEIFLPSDGLDKRYLSGFFNAFSGYLGEEQISLIIHKADKTRFYIESSNFVLGETKLNLKNLPKVEVKEVENIFTKKNKIEEKKGDKTILKEVTLLEKTKFYQNVFKYNSEPIKFASLERLINQLVPNSGVIINLRLCQEFQAMAQENDRLEAIKKAEQDIQDKFSDKDPLTELLYIPFNLAWGLIALPYKLLIQSNSFKDPYQWQSKKESKVFIANILTFGSPTIKTYFQQSVQSNLRVIEAKNPFNIIKPAFTGNKRNKFTGFVNCEELSNLWAYSSINPKLIENANAKPILSSGKIEFGKSGDSVLNMDILALMKHLITIGATGGGKSWFFMQILLEIMLKHPEYFVFLIDPKDSTAVDLLVRMQDETYQKVVYLNPNQGDYIYTNNPLFTPCEFNYQGRLKREIKMSEIKAQFGKLPITIDPATEILLSIGVGFHSLYRAWLTENLKAKGLEGEELKSKVKEISDERQLTFNDLGIFNRQPAYIEMLMQLASSHLASSYLQDLKVKIEQLHEALKPKKSKEKTKADNRLEGGLEGACARLKELGTGKLMYILEGNKMDIIKIKESNRPLLLTTPPINDQNDTNDSSIIFAKMLVTGLWDEVQKDFLGKQKTAKTILALEEAKTMNIPALQGILDRGRQMELALLMVCQFIDQFDVGFRKTIINNVDSLFVYNCGNQEASSISEGFLKFKTDNFLTVPDYHFIARHKKNEFLAKGLNLDAPNSNHNKKRIKSKTPYEKNKECMEEFGEHIATIMTRMDKKQADPVNYFLRLD